MNATHRISQSDFANKEMLKKAFELSSYSKVWPSIEPLLKSSTRLTLISHDDDDIKIGQSKVGGYPDLPLDFELPEHKGLSLTFLAQINLQESSLYDIDSLLPKSGMLYFFMSETGWDANQLDSDLSLVYYFDDKHKLHRKSPLSGAVVLKSCLINFHYELNIPHINSLCRPALLDIFDQDIDALCDFFDDVSYGPFISKLFGYANAFQRPVELEIGWKYDENNSLTEDSINASELDAPNWQLLFQLDEDEATDLYLGSGRLYFLIKHDALQDRHFETTIMTGQR